MHLGFKVHSHTCMYSVIYRKIHTIVSIPSENSCPIFIKVDVHNPYDKGLLYKLREWVLKVGKSYFVHHRRQFVVSSSLLTLHIFDISSESSVTIFTKLGMHDPKVIQIGGKGPLGTPQGSKTGKIRSNLNKNTYLKLAMTPAKCYVMKLRIRAFLVILVSALRPLM